MSRGQVFQIGKQRDRNTVAQSSEKDVMNIMPAYQSTYMKWTNSTKTYPNWFKTQGAKTRAPRSKDKELTKRHFSYKKLHSPRGFYHSVKVKMFPSPVSFRKKWEWEVHVMLTTKPPTSEVKGTYTLRNTQKPSRF